MDFVSFQKQISSIQSNRWTARQKRLEALNRALTGRLYEHKSHDFSEERTGIRMDGERVLLNDRRAAVEDGLPAEATREMCGLLFGEARRPNIKARNDDATTEWISAFIRDVQFWLLMFKTTWEASVGSACVVGRVLGKYETDAEGGFTPKGKGAFHFEVWPSYECKPIFHRTAPDQLKSVERVWFLGEDALAADGYDVEALKRLWDKDKERRGIRRVKSSATVITPTTDWALRIILDDKNETWFLPTPRWIYERGDWVDSNWRLDDERTFTHELGEVPAVWAVPLPLDAKLHPDGMPIFDEKLINYQFRIDRTLSQTGRAFDYVGDPQMAQILDKATAGGGAFGFEDDELAIGGSASDVITQSGGDLKFLEIRGEGLKVALENYIATLSDKARATGAMSRIVPDAKALGQLSAVAMKMLNQGQISLADVLRVTVGEGTGFAIIRLAIRLFLAVDVALPSLENDVKPKPDAIFEASWPDYYESRGQDRLYEVQAEAAAVTAGLISQETGVANAANLFDVLDASHEYNAIQSEQKAKSQAGLEVTEQTAQIAKKYAVKPSKS